MSELREALKAAMQGDGAEAPEPVEAVTGVVETAAPETGAATPPEPQNDNTDPADKGSPDRDEHGRFRAKAETPEGASAQPPADPAKPAPASEKPQETEAQAEPIRIPASLPAAVKAKYATLDPDVQKAFVALEETVHTSKAEWDKKANRFNRYDEIVGPHLDGWRIKGLDEFSALQSLIAAQSILDRNPVEGLLQVARSYGVTPAHLAQAFGLSQTSAPRTGQEGQPAPTLPADLQAALRTVVEPLQQQVQTFQQTMQESAQAAEATARAQVQAEVQAFSGRPENMYFDNVRDDVAALLSSGRVKTEGRPTQEALKEAYDRACWASPEIRPLLLKAQADDQAKAAREADTLAKREADAKARSRSQAAQTAAGSVTGAPAAGLAPAETPHGNLRETLQAAMRQHAPQV